MNGHSMAWMDTGRWKEKYVEIYDEYFDGNRSDIVLTAAQLI